MTVPPALQNLISDLRDRNLLPVVVGLVVAIFAVPVVLGNGEPESPAASSSSAELAGGTADGAPEPVVLASVSDVRAYRERLQAYEKKDPFAPIAERKRSGGENDGAGSSPRALVPDAAPAPGDAPEPHTATPVGDAPPAGTEEPPAPTPDPAPAPDPDPAPEPGDEPGPDDEGEGPAEEPQLLTPVVDVTVGPKRHVRRLNRVTVGDYLPNRADPIAQYIEGSLDGENATFLLSPAARSFDGDGRCEPDRTKCKALVLEPGETAYIYDEIGTRYTLKLAEVRVIEISEKELDGLDFEPGFPTKRRPAYEMLPTTAVPPPSL